MKPNTQTSNNAMNRLGFRLFPASRSSYPNHRNKARTFLARVRKMLRMLLDREAGSTRCSRTHAKTSLMGRAGCSNTRCPTARKRTTCTATGRDGPWQRWRPNGQASTRCSPRHSSVVPGPCPSNRFDLCPSVVHGAPVRSRSTPCGHPCLARKSGKELPHLGILLNPRAKL